MTLSFSYARQIVSLLVPLVALTVSACDIEALGSPSTHTDYSEDSDTGLGPLGLPDTALDTETGNDTAAEPSVGSTDDTEVVADSETAVDTGIALDSETVEDTDTGDDTGSGDDTETADSDFQDTETTDTGFEDTETVGGDTEDTETVDEWTPPTVDPNELPASVQTVEIIISEADQAALEAAPFYGEDVIGTFIDGNGKRYEEVDVNYRGAYALNGLIQYDLIGRRNWKVKFPKADMYRGRREWNFNFEPHLRQKMAYDLMKFAGVRVPNAEHVVLLVNGEPFGVYLQYEDPDSKDWLYDKFGNDEGDLYKAGLDLPASEGEPVKKLFADTTYLGDADSDYPGHYNKKTNHKDPLIADDFSVLRDFLDGLNHTPEDGLKAWFEVNLDVEGFINFLVVSNFISNWDTFPQRPKNYWLFEDRRAEEMVFIPWDLDAAFQPEADRFNQMGAEASVYYSLRSPDYTPIHEEEGEDRPLATRLFSIPEFEQAYVDRYVALCDTILSKAYLTDRIDALSALVAPHLTDAETSEGFMGSDPATERSDFEDALGTLREFVDIRVDVVRSELGLD